MADTWSNNGTGHDELQVHWIRSEYKCQSWPIEIQSLSCPRKKSPLCFIYRCFGKLFSCVNFPTNTWHSASWIKFYFSMSLTSFSIKPRYLAKSLALLTGRQRATSDLVSASVLYREKVLPNLRWESIGSKVRQCSLEQVRDSFLRTLRQCLFDASLNIIRLRLGNKRRRKNDTRMQ